MVSEDVENFRYLGIAIGSLISITGAVGNLLAIVAFCSNKRIRTSFNLLVVNLAIVDFITSTTVVPIVVYGYYKMERYLSPQSCSVFAYFYFSAQYTSAVFLMVISINRFLHVSCHHSTYSLVFSLKRRRVLAVLTWFISPLILLPLLFTNGFGWVENGGYFCTFTRFNGFANTYGLIMRVLFQIVPLLSMIILYTLVFRTVKHSHACVDNNAGSTCNSILASTETWMTATTPVRTPSPVTFQKNFILQSRSCSPIARSQFGGSDLEIPKKKNSPIEVKDSHSIKNRTNPIFFIEKSSDSEKSTLEKKKIHTRYALVCRSSNLVGAGDSENSLNEKYKMNLKHRSVTFNTLDSLDLPDLHRNNFSSSKIINRQLSLNGINTNFDIKREKAKSDAPVRPNHLNLSSLEENGFEKKLRSPPSLPSLTRSFHSPSFINKLDFFSQQQQKERRRLSRKSKQHAKAQRKLLYMCIIICSAFALCSIPSFIINFFGNYDDITAEYHILTTILSWLTALINPIVYAAMNMQFRKEYSRLFRGFTGMFVKRKTKSSNLNLNAPTIRVSDTFVKHG